MGSCCEKQNTAASEQKSKCCDSEPNFRADRASLCLSLMVLSRCRWECDHCAFDCCSIIAHGRRSIARIYHSMVHVVVHIIAWLHHSIEHSIVYSIARLYHGVVHGVVHSTGLLYHSISWHRAIPDEKNVA